MGSLSRKLLGTAALGSQLVNVWIFDGSNDETISGRSYREGVLGGDETWRKRAGIIDRAFKVLFNQHNHCQKSHERDLKFAEMILDRVL